MVNQLPQLCSRSVYSGTTPLLLPSLLLFFSSDLAKVPTHTDTIPSGSHSERYCTSFHAELQCCHCSINVWLNVGVSLSDQTSVPWWEQLQIMLVHQENAVVVFAARDTKFDFCHSMHCMFAISTGCSEIALFWLKAHHQLEVVESYFQNRGTIHLLAWGYGVAPPKWRAEFSVKIFVCCVVLMLWVIFSHVRCVKWSPLIRFSLCQFRMELISYARPNVWNKIC